VDQEAMRRRVADARVAHLSTVDRGGRPHLVPFCFVLDGDEVLSTVDAKPKRTRRLKRLDNIRANPAVSVLVDHYEEDWRRLWWVRLDGQAEVVEGGSRSRRALGLLAGKYEQYRQEPPAGPVLSIHVRHWAGWEP
jgi:PPOX class probable F420-dependent enzyme